MEICLLRKTENDNKEYRLLLNHINIITFNNGILHLPQTNELGQLTILFKCKGEFTIKAEGKKFQLGNCIDEEVYTEPGSPEYDTQPTFIHCDNLWLILSAGLFCFQGEKK